MAAVPPASPAPTALPPPATPAEAALVRLIGAEAALALIEAHGGTRVPVPKGVNQGTLLAREIGLDAARILSRHHGGEMIKVPLGRAWRARIYRERDGLSYSAIARKLGASESSVWSWLSEAGTTKPQQMDLFAPPG